MTLVELMIVLAIGLILTLAVTTVLLRSEGAKRTAMSVNEVDQTGSYVAFVLDRSVRSAGAGFTQSWDAAVGCLLNVTSGGEPVLPVSAPYPTSAFASFTAPIRLAPVVIGKGLANAGAGGGVNGGDVLFVMSGTSASSDVAATVSSISGGSAVLPNRLLYTKGDLVLLANASMPGGCMVEQIDSVTPSFGSVSLGGNYYAAIGASVSLSSFGGQSSFIQIGSETNLPDFQAFAVGQDHTLFAWDLLKPVGAGSIPDVAIANGVVEMRALYGVSNTAPYTLIDTWVDPSGSWAASALTDGSAASKLLLRRILAIRLGLILRTSLQEQTPESAAQSSAGYVRSSNEITLFSDLLGGALTQTRSLSGSDLRYRYRTVELTIPLRNVQFAP